jgi:hypothetical protein
VPRALQAGVRGAAALAVAALCAAGGGSAFGQAAAPPGAPLVAPLVAALDRCIADLEAESHAADVSAADAYAEPDPGESGDEPEEGGRRKPAPFVERCPAAHAGLAGSALAPQLPPDWDKRVSAEKLRRYRALLTAGAAPSGPRPDPAAVAAIVRQTEGAVELQGRSLWQRFKDWLRAWLERESRDAQDDWLARWLDEHFPSARIVNAILYAVLVAMIGLAGWFVYSELRATGVLERWRRRRQTGVIAADTPDAAPRAPTLAGASDEQAPSILVALLLAELRRLGRVQDRSSMTHRELAGAARFDAGADGETFRSLLGAAERLRYAAAPPPAGSLRAVVEAGGRLLETLLREPRGAT